MTKPVKRQYFSRGKGILSAAGAQARFIVFLIFLLIGYTFLLKIFQKLTGIVEFALFLPIALVSLLAFIGVSGALYSHKFMGPVARIRRTLEQVADGDCSVTLRLREADDPMMKELAQTVVKLCERGRRDHRELREAMHDLQGDLADLAGRIRAGDNADLMAPLLERIQNKRAALERIIGDLGN